MALNMKDFLAEEDFGSELFNIATQNNSKAEFFRLRNVIFDVVTKQTHKFFEENIKDIAVTLDKGAKYLWFFLLSFPQNQRKIY